MTYFTSSADKFGRVTIYAATSCLNHLCPMVASCHSDDVDAVIALLSFEE